MKEREIKERRESQFDILYQCMNDLLILKYDACMFVSSGDVHGNHHTHGVFYVGEKVSKTG